MQYVVAGDGEGASSSTGGGVKLSFAMETGWHGESLISPGWNYTGCATSVSCRYTQEDYDDNIRRCEEGGVDFEYTSIEEAFGGTTGSDGTNVTKTKTIFLEQYADVDIAFYNRGLWGKITDNRARQMMKLLHDFTTPSHGDTSKGRCFFKTTSGCPRSLDDKIAEHDYDVVRKAAYAEGCEYMDVGHLTEEFSLLLFGHPPPPRNVMSEYRTVFFWDAVHYQPWVYEELNNLLLNVLCNTA
ncbi:hypothetical protein ACHAW5_002326 [Stephanodiscus triporus]|uniref:Phospholipase B-like n=1 Tax=Stephanodiscus triporus TaxID=2934178 RepID=A0ABD3N2T4_9STRA